MGGDLGRSPPRGGEVMKVTIPVDMVAEVQ